MIRFNRTITNKLAVLFIITSGLLAACEKNEFLMLQGRTMGTSYTIQLENKPDINPDMLSSQIDAILDEVDKSMSTWRDDSELSKINRTDSTQWINVSPDLLYVLELGQLVSRNTNGAFDITLDPLIDLWGFSTHEIKQSIPDNEAIEATLKKIGYHYLTVDVKRKAIKKDIPLKINLSAIAKGFAVDKIARHLDSNSINTYLVEVGGEIRAKGTKKDGERWSIAVEEPMTQERRVHRIIKVTDQAIATSGDYRNFYEINGQHFSHTINPATGRPVTHNLASVTVIGSNAAYSDALATALMVMGPEKGYQFCNRYKIPAYFIIKSGDSYVTKYTRYMEKYFVTG